MMMDGVKLELFPHTRLTRAYEQVLYASPSQPIDGKYFVNGGDYSEF
jgi:hypothetical protein